MRKLVLFISFVVTLTLFGDPAHESTILICGVCKDIQDALPNTIKYTEALGRKFKKYQIIIYENNSSDNTVALLKEWAEANPNVNIFTENLSDSSLPASRTERIARARNVILEIAGAPAYSDYKYFIMADLDFQMPWPVNEVVEVIESPIEWDCVSANSLLPNGDYWDRYAFRNENFPLGPELIGSNWWSDVTVSWFKIESENWKPVYSAFGGLAIYKRDVVTRFRYSGVVTKDLKQFYRKIIHKADPANGQIQKYLTMINKKSKTQRELIPVIFRRNTPWNQPRKYKKITCCEHLPLHASMSENGYDRFFIHPRMTMHYYTPDQKH